MIFLRIPCTHGHVYLPLLLLLLLRLLPQGLVLPLQLLQRSDLRLLEAMHLLLVVRAQLAQLLLVALVLLTQRLGGNRRWFYLINGRQTARGFLL